MNYSKRLLIISVLFCTITSPVFAQTTAEIQAKIDERNNAIDKLESEIKKYQEDIVAVGKEKDSLNTTIKSLDLSKKKLEADTKVTENKIAAKNLEIQELSLQIGDKSGRIEDGRRIIGRSLFNIYQNDSTSLIENILNKKSFSDIWRSVGELEILQGSMQAKIIDLESLKNDLESNKKLTEKKKGELVALTSDYKNQTKILVGTVKEKSTLLAETKSTEANYAKALREKQAQKEAYEREVSNLESSLKLIIDPNSIPTAGSSVLQYPLSKARVTQFFGNTTFATKNPQVYKGSKGEHNGIDFAASIGTPVKAALSGVVSHMVTTSSRLKCGYGNWITIKHPNGLTTLYAHLSLNTLQIGDSVYTGQIIGYSGNTGYTTGPHLHFGVYVTEGLQVTKSVSCPGIVIPYAPFSAYLNPFSFL